MSESVDLAIELLSKPSITPDDAGCQALINQRLAACGFQCEVMQFGQVTNLWAIHGDDGPLFCFAGHTDVVSPGDESQWRNPPFIPTLRDGIVTARGAVDMKSALAAMVVATEKYLASKVRPNGRIAFLVTSDEEDGATREGTAQVIETLNTRGVKIDYCLIGEPTSENALGDMIKNGRRGSLSCRVEFHGVQGHIAYPDKAKNPIPLAIKALSAVLDYPWDKGNAYFQPTQCQVSNIQSGIGVGNVIPPTLTADFNFRYSSELSADDIQKQTEKLFSEFDIPFECHWHLSGIPFLTGRGKLLDAVSRAVEMVCGLPPVISTSGGTSDGRFIAPTGCQVVECGCLNASAHKIDENVPVADIEKLERIYQSVLVSLLG